MSFQKGISYLAMKEYEIALNFFQQENDQGSQLYQAICLYKLQKYEESLEIIRTINDRRYIDLAKVYTLKLYMKLKIDISQKELQDQADGQSALFHYTLGRYLLQVDQIEARKQFDLAITKQPNYYKAELYRCLTYNNHRPVLELAKLVRKYPCEQKGHLFIICNFYENQEYEQVLIQYEQAISLGPVPSYIHQMQIESLIQLKKFNEAKNILNYIGTNDLRMGKILAHLRQLDKAIEFYKDHDDKESILYYADCLFLKEEYNDALEIYKQAKIAIQIFKISIILRNYDIAKDVLNLIVQEDNNKPSKLFNDNFEELIKNQQQIIEYLDQNINPDDMIEYMEKFNIQFKLEEPNEVHSHISDLNQKSYSSYHSQQLEEVQIQENDVLEIISQHSEQFNQIVQGDKQSNESNEEQLIREILLQLERTQNGLKQLAYFKGFYWILFNYLNSYQNLHNSLLDCEDLVELYFEQCQLYPKKGISQEILQGLPFQKSSFIFIETCLSCVFKAKIKKDFIERRDIINCIINSKCTKEQDLEIQIAYAGLELLNIKQDDILNQKFVKNRLSDYVIAQKQQINIVFDSNDAIQGITDAIYVLYKFYDEFDFIKQSKDPLDKLIVNFIISKPQNELSSQIMKIEQGTPTKEQPRDSCGCIIQ